MEPNKVNDDVEIQSKSEAEKDSDSESLNTSLDIEIPKETKKCVMLKSIFNEERPATVFFQYNYEKTLMKKNSENNARIDRELDWNEKGNNQFCVMYKAYKNIPECIIIPMDTNGIVRTKSFLKANFIWKLLKGDKMSTLIKKLNKYQRFNHFPCTWQLGRKDNLWKNFKIMSHQFPEDFDYIPETFLLPEDHGELITKIKSEPEALWMIKPVASSRGRGIRLMTSIESVPRRCLISSYIQNPNLINNKKYDLRLYVVITGFSPLKVYLFNEGLVRFASEDYNTEEANKHNRYMHLTNYSVNKCSSHFDTNISTADECTGSKWSLTALKTYFEKSGIKFSATWEKIKDIVIKSIISIHDDTVQAVNKLTQNKNNLFELYGFDILIDQNLRPWLLEINLNPSLNCESDLDVKVKSALMTDIFTLVGIVPYSHSKNRKKDPQILHKANEEDGNCEQVLYALDEFSRQGMFNRLFPLKENIEYYSKFIENPGDDNISLWKWMQDEDQSEEKSKISVNRVFNETSDI